MERSWEIRTTDVLDGLRAMPAGSVHCVVTSPPYYGLRDYGVDGQIGLEKTPEEYVAKMVEVFGEVRRVMRDDATLWLNIGDSFASGKGTCHNPGGNTSSFNVHLKANNVHPLDRGNKSSLAKIGLKPKDLIGIPWMLAFALRANGWYLRSEIIWAKRSPMPESVTDRPTKAHEQIFLLSKSPRYFYDEIASAEKALNTCTGRTAGGKSRVAVAGEVRSNGSMGDAIQGVGLSTRNMRSVWRLSSEPFTDWIATSRRALVSLGVLSDGTMHKASPGCPLHGCSDHQHSSRVDDGRAADESSRSERTYDHRGPGQSNGCASTDHRREPSIAEQSSDYLPQSYSPTATQNNNQTHKTAPDPETTVACTPSAQTSSRTGGTPELLALTAPDHDTDASNTSAGDLPSGSQNNQTAADIADKPIGSELRGASLASLREKGCTCEFYRNVTEKTSHFATYPTELVRRCLLAGTSEKGCCATCGAPWRRVTKKERRATRPGENTKTPGRNSRFYQERDPQHPGEYKADRYALEVGNRDPKRHCTETVTVGWQPGCKCGAEPIPCMVLDPFAGAGTTIVVARRLQLRAIGLELNPTYAEMARCRIRDDLPLLNQESA